MSTGDDDVFNAGPLERYQARPDGEPFDNMSLAQFLYGTMLLIKVMSRHLLVLNQDMN